MPKRILPTAPELTRLQRLTDAENSLMSNYRLLGAQGRKLIADIIARVIADTVSEAQDCNVTALGAAFNVPENDGAGEPTRLHRMTVRELHLVHAYRVMCEEEKSAMDYMFKQYLIEDQPRGDNVVSIRP